MKNRSETVKCTSFFINAAKCVVFIPGAAHMSNIVLPGVGASKWGAMHVA